MSHIPHEIKAAAKAILDAVKRGEDIPRDRITWALRITGDLT